MTEPNKVSSTLLQKIKPVNLLLIGLMIGSISIIALRMLLISNDAPHYHANFALYINGEQDKFDNFTFYEEVAGCNADSHNDPKHRVHMHNNVNDAVHVHAEGVTWGHFFANLGYGLSNNLVKTDEGVFVDGQNGKKLTFILNGQETGSIANKLINSEDVLLVDYGEEDDARKHYDKIPKTAGELNLKPDPASCSGSEGLSLGERFKRALDFTR